MFRMITTARTHWVGEMKTENKDSYESKTIAFRVISNRPTKERQADSMFCVAYGNTAQAISDYASAKDKDNKLISRHLELSGYLKTETVSKTVEMRVNAPVNGTKKTLVFPYTFEEERTTFVVKEVEFLDSTKKQSNSSNNGVYEVSNVVVEDLAEDTNIPTANDVSGNTQQPVINTNNDTNAGGLNVSALQQNGDTPF